MSETKEIEPMWVSGRLECSFTTAHYLHDEIQGLTLNHIQPIGRKILSDVAMHTGELSSTNQGSFLGDRFLLGLEVFPSAFGEYPLDIARKFNAEDVVIVNPEISEIRDVDGIRHGLLKADITCRLRKLNDQAFNDELKKHKLIHGTSSFVDSSSNGCLPSVSRGGCANIPSLGSGCLNMPLSGGCLNFGRIGCGGLISLLLLLGLLTLFLRACDGNSSKRDNSDSTEQSDQDDSPWFTSDSTDNRKDNSDSDEARRDNSDSDETRNTDDTGTNSRDTVEIIETESIVLPNVQFYTNSNRLLPSSAKDLDRLSLYLLEHLECKANVFGHTDSRGNDNFNLKLSQSRASRVRSYLIEKGIDPGRLKAIGKGETEPRASNDSQEGMLMNRRVEIEIIHGRKIKPRKK